MKKIFVFIIFALLISVNGISYSLDKVPFTKDDKTIIKDILTTKGEAEDLSFFPIFTGYDSQNNIILVADVYGNFKYNDSGTIKSHIKEIPNPTIIKMTSDKEIIWINELYLTNYNEKAYEQGVDIIKAVLDEDDNLIVIGKSSSEMRYKNNTGDIDIDTDNSKDFSYIIKISPDGEILNSNVIMKSVSLSNGEMELICNDELVAVLEVDYNGDGNNISILNFYDKSLQLLSSININDIILIKNIYIESIMLDYKGNLFISFNKYENDNQAGYLLKMEPYTNKSTLFKFNHDSFFRITSMATDKDGSTFAGVYNGNIKLDKKLGDKELSYNPDRSCDVSFFAFRLNHDNKLLWLSEIGTGYCETNGPMIVNDKDGNSVVLSNDWPIGTEYDNQISTILILDNKGNVTYKEKINGILSFGACNDKIILSGLFQIDDKTKIYDYTDKIQFFNGTILKELIKK